ncbi:biotin--[acetyl-CoA-carboxylase] ligase [Marixanthomonas ophiurae]|uniref:Biotin--[acetyl-CoA-carboxylase] ligase n=1 Tax=Marixanthomonas ophiurae TaxID=387659 RepID=A0A3E1QCQ3_9FLAO|nr:biotin--[acetyl-CoA-carboxylase] ligase [Marixanthomonas ophiurae]RFN59918.1 biotin--[acetyl-CoA-carboxylase] ligase [Marixanthomonas ophiurae]
MKIIKLNAIDSTNTYLKSLNKEVTLEDEVIVHAKNQLAGRGQRASTWQSNPGESLTFSVFKRIANLPAENQFLLVMLTALAVKDVLNEIKVPNVTIKWPNDILSRSKKLCGVLTENTLQNTAITSCISGIGLNVNETSFENLPAATSIRMATEKKVDIDEVFLAVVKSVLKRLRSIPVANFQKIKQEYEASLFRKNKVSTFERPSGLRFNGVITGIMDSGALLVEHESGELESFQMKEIRLLY